MVCIGWAFMRRAKKIWAMNWLFVASAFVLASCGDNGLKLGWTLAEKKTAAVASPAAGSSASEQLAPTSVPPSRPEPTPGPNPTSKPISGPKQKQKQRPGSEPTPTPTSPPNSDIPDEEAAQRVAIVTLTNAFRARAELERLELNPHLSLSAQAYAERMAAENYFEHNSPGGDAPKDRCDEAGYTGSHLGENIARGYVTPHDTMVGWIKSPSHRRNLMLEGARDIGVGHAIGRCDDNNSCHYWVQEFGQP